MKFIDELNIHVCGGNGGHGMVSFEREKYRPWGGPDGGNGGRGGDVYLHAHSSVATLGKLLGKTNHCAKNGQPGSGRRKSGADGQDLKLSVPVGTEVLDEDSRQVLADLAYPEACYLAAKGGKGGLGNYNFATATCQKPEYAQPGLLGQQATLFLRLKLIADVGLVGLPNAGKSSLLAGLSAKKPKIGDYPFTTLTPNIAVVENTAYRRLYLADIPGIIAGSSRGVGLGLAFLKHIERVSVIVYVLDAQRFDFEAELLILQEELRSYSPVLLQKPKLVVINKCDLFAYDSRIVDEISLKISNVKLWQDFKVPQVICISAKQKKGLEFVIKHLFALSLPETQAEKSLQSSYADTLTRKPHI